MEEIAVIWDDAYKGLDYKFIPTYQINPAFDIYHHEEYKTFIGNDAYFLPDPMPKFVSEILNLEPFNNYDIVSPGFHRIRPGMGLPLHIDGYDTFSKIHNIKNTNDIIRHIIFLEDAKRGHIIQVGDKVFGSWNAGNYISWRGHIEHAAFNLGIEDRYTLQITCLRHTTY